MPIAAGLQLAESAAEHPVALLAIVAAIWLSILWPSAIRFLERHSPRR